MKNKNDPGWDRLPPVLRHPTVLYCVKVIIIFLLVKGCPPPPPTPLSLSLSLSLSLFPSLLTIAYSLVAVWDSEYEIDCPFTVDEHASYQVVSDNHFPCKVCACDLLQPLRFILILSLSNTWPLASSTVRSGAEERTPFSGARLDVLIFRLRSYHVHCRWCKWSIGQNLKKKHLMFLVQAWRSSAFDLTVLLDFPWQLVFHDVTLKLWSRLQNCEYELICIVNLRVGVRLLLYDDNHWWLYMNLLQTLLSKFINWIKNSNKSMQLQKGRRHFWTKKQATLL